MQRGVKVLPGPFWQASSPPERVTSLQVQSYSKSGWYLWILQENGWINSLPKWKKKLFRFIFPFSCSYWSVFSFPLPPCLHPSRSFPKLFLSFLSAPSFPFLYFTFISLFGLRCLLKSIKTTNTSVWVKMLIGLLKSSGVFWVQLIVDQRHPELLASFQFSTLPSVRSFLNPDLSLKIIFLRAFMGN